MLAADWIARKTSVVRYRQRTTRSGRTRDIQTFTSRMACNSKEIVFEPSLAHVACRLPTHVGAGVDSRQSGGNGRRG